MGLNPHCESIDKYSEEEKIIKPSIKILKKRGILAHGPFAADTFFLNFEGFFLSLSVLYRNTCVFMETMFPGFLDETMHNHLEITSKGYT